MKKQAIAMKKQAIAACGIDLCRSYTTFILRI
jgi:hypothetical protein